MGQFVIRPAIKREATINYVAKAALYGAHCASCHTVFLMEPWCNDSDQGVLKLTFTKGNPETGRGNFELFDCCSMECAGRLVDDGGWRSIDRLQGYVRVEATIGRAVYHSCPGNVLSEDELIEAWERQKEREVDGQGFYKWEPAKEPKVNSENLKGFLLGQAYEHLNPEQRMWLANQLLAGIPVKNLDA